MKRIAALLLIAACAWPTPARTESRTNNTNAGEDVEELQELMKILDEETTVATKTKLNSDYVPGMVTVLQGEDLEALGIATVWEALGLVPGIQTYRSNLGEPFVTVRGLQFPFNSGNIKILVNSVTMNRETSAVNTSILLLPIEQVERIEVIRGPGSSIYGDFAFVGLVNVITRKDENSAFASLAQRKRYAGGAQVSAKENDLHFSANVAGWTSDTGEGPLDNIGKENRLSAVTSLAYKNTSVSYQMVDRNYTAVNKEKERNQAIAFKHHQPFRNNWYAEIDAQYHLTDNDSPSIYFKGDLMQGEADLGWTGQQVKGLVTVFGTHANTGHATLIPLNNPTNQIDIRNTDWKAYGAAAQVQIDLPAKLTTTAGLRYDSRTDIHADRFTPRLAIVWRALEHHLLKAQYAQGFRAPTFFELYGLNRQGNFNLNFETAGTAEMSYVFRNVQRTARVTVFDTKVKNMIYPAGVNGGNQTPPRQQQPPGQQPPPLSVSFQNIARAKSRGIELEWEQQLTDALKWSANLSYATAKDTRTRNFQEEITPGMAHWLGNVSLIAHPLRNLVLTGYAYYVSSRSSDQGPVDGYTRVDVSLSILNAGVRELTLRTGLKDIFNDQIRYLLSLPNGVVVHPYDGRTWWLRLAYKL